MTTTPHSLSEPRVVGPARVPLTADEPRTLVEVFERIAAVHKRPDTLNYKKHGHWISISSSEMLERVHRIAAGLYELGVRRGDRVALLSESRAEWTLMDAGCLFAGAIDVPIYATLTPQQVLYILKDSGARVLVLSNHLHFLRIKEVLLDCPTVTNLIFFDAEGLQENEGIALSELEQRGQKLTGEQPRLIKDLSQEARPEELATIIYTSGTTGEPKGVMLTNSNIVSNLIDSACHFS